MIKDNIKHLILFIKDNFICISLFYLLFNFKIIKYLYIFNLYNFLIYKISKFIWFKG